MYLRRETGTTRHAAAGEPRRRIPLSLAYTLSYGRTEATAGELLRLVQRLHSGRGGAPAAEPGPRAPSPAIGTRAAGQQPDRSHRAGSLKSLEVTWSSRFLGSALVPAVRPRRGRRLVVPPADARRGAQLATSAAARSSPPTVDVATQTGNFVPPEQRFYAGGPNDVRGFDRNELGPVVYVVSKAEVDDAAADSGRRINPDSVPGRGHRRQHARGRQRRAPGALARVQLAAPAGGVRGRRRRLAAAGGRSA